MGDEGGTGSGVVPRRASERWGPASHGPPGARAGAGGAAWCAAARRQGGAPEPNTAGGARAPETAWCAAAEQRAGGAPRAITAGGARERRGTAWCLRTRSEVGPRAMRPMDRTSSAGTLKAIVPEDGHLFGLPDHRSAVSAGRRRDSFKIACLGIDRYFERYCERTAAASVHIDFARPTCSMRSTPGGARLVCASRASRRGRRGDGRVEPSSHPRRPGLAAPRPGARAGTAMRAGRSCARACRSAHRDPQEAGSRRCLP